MRGDELSPTGPLPQRTVPFRVAMRAGANHLAEVVRIDHVAIGGEDGHLSTGTIPIVVAGFAIRELHDQSAIREAAELVAVFKTRSPINSTSSLTA